jgi:alcohol dehydrogenase
MRTKRRSLLTNSLLLHGPKTLHWAEEILPPLGDRDVLVETIAGAISIGSELPRYKGEAREAGGLRFPMMTGYESYARITALGSEVNEKLLGETVVAFYGHRSHMILPAERLIFAPSRIPPPTALLLILSCDVAKAIRKLQIQPEERVLITGAGAIGLLAVWLLKRYGIQTVHVLEPEAKRREKALELGASLAVFPEEAESWPAEYPVAIECSSRDSAFQLLQERAAPQGRIAVLSDGNLEPFTLSPHFHSKELRIIASSDGWDYQQHALWFWKAVEEDSRLADTLFELTIMASDLPKTFAALAKGEISPIKVLVNYKNL